MKTIEQEWSQVNFFLVDEAEWQVKEHGDYTDGYAHLRVFAEQVKILRDQQLKQKRNKIPALLR